MRTIFFLLLFFVSSSLLAQLGFCEGSKGDPIFHETFGVGDQPGPPLPPGVTTYTYVTHDPQDGQYTISNTIGSTIGGWHTSLPNSTVSNERALIVNASFTSGQFFRTEVSGLCQNTTYEFSAYLMNIYDRSQPNCESGGIPVNVRFEIWDETDSVLLKEGSTGNIHSTTSPEWRQFALTFQSGADQESIILKMFNNGDGGCGNDLAIDDIIFRSCGDLTTVTTDEGVSDQLNICEESTPANISLKAIPDFSVYSSHFFQWQESRDGDTWQDIPGATTDTYASVVSSSKYFRVKVAENEANLTDNLCSSATEAFFINILETPQPPVSNGDRQICSNESIPPLSVTPANGEGVNWYDSPRGGELLAEGTTSYTPGSAGTFYAEARKEGFECEPGDRTAVSLTIFPAPTAGDETLYLCENAVLRLDAGVPGMAYSWSTGENTQVIQVSSTGNFTVEISTPRGCTTIKTIEVKAAPVPMIRQIISEDRRVIILLEEEGLFEFSLNGRDFQQSNVFEDVSGGIYTAYVRDIGDCNVITREFAHIVIPRYITPNNDGRNDYFEVRGMSFYPSSEVHIFDRYGKLLRTGPGIDFRWDGTFRGNSLPADDYWYLIIIEGLENKRGHFSLIR